MLLNEGDLFLILENMNMIQYLYTNNNMYTFHNHSTNNIERYSIPDFNWNILMGQISKLEE